MHKFGVHCRTSEFYILFLLFFLGYRMTYFLFRSGLIWIISKVYIYMQHQSADGLAMWVFLFFIKPKTAIIQCTFHHYKSVYRTIVTEEKSIQNQTKLTKTRLTVHFIKHNEERMSKWIEKKWVFRFSKKKTIKTLFIDHKQWNNFFFEKL